MFNTVNPAGYQGNLLTNRFDVSESLANTGGQNVSANRRPHLAVAGHIRPTKAMGRKSMAT